MIKTQKLIESENNESNNAEINSSNADHYFLTEIKWNHVLLLSGLHVAAVYFGYQFFFCKFSLILFLWQNLIGIIGGFGTTAGVHRLWTHKSYKANIPLKIILLICYSVAGQNSIYNWVRDHRIHHLYSETDADPHNSNRGFFFSHIGWLMMKKHPKVIEMGRKVDMSDITNDPLLCFYQKYFRIFQTFFCIILPTAVPVYLWSLSWEICFYATMIRYILNLNFTWSVNSAAHLWGYKPYNRYINPSENFFVAFVSYGEGWHNYHHTFPWDYRTSELSPFKINLTKNILDFFAWIGWATDLKFATEEMIEKVAKSKGDRSYNCNYNNENDDTTR